MSVYDENTKDMKLGAVTLLDVLGWKGIWQRKTDAVKVLLQLISGIEKRTKNILGSEKVDHRPNIFKDLEVEVKTISDTIGHVTYGDCTSSLEFHAIMSNLIICKSILEGIPVRGATCYGYFTTENNIMVGPAIDEVASWYECAEWIGVILTPSALFQVNVDDFVYRKEALIEHEVQVKQLGKIKTYCCNWPANWIYNKKNKTELLDVFLQMGPILPSIAVKYINTISFYDESIKIRESRELKSLIAVTKE